ncbi:MAG TPA: DNA primase [Candidatus Paceibacterota bacterium]|nr:DNA primase [Candidatus Paceibacterota bacterium]
MASSTTDLIKSKLDIVEFIRGYVALAPAGKNFKGLCPFHKEKSPSFMVSPDRQSWHCFGCGTGGSVFDFVMKYDNIEFGEALRMLAEKAGVELRRENPAEYRYSGLLYDLNDAAKNFFKKALAAAPVAREYLAKRGLAARTVEEFEIGWAPNEPEGLSMYFLNSGSAPQDLVQAGLSIKTERGLMLDRFRGRIMFPIHNHTGKVVGFTGRILPQLDRGDMGKYVNSPETPIFQKSKLIYGFWKSKEAIREEKSAFLVEGQMDFLMSYQSGVRNVIASSGTALTEDYLRVVHRLAENLIVSFDNDTAGSDAAERAIDLAEAQDFGVKVAIWGSLGAGVKDAADAALADPANIRKVLDSAIPAPEFYFAKYLPRDPVTGAVNATAVATREGLRNLRAILGKLKHIASPVERDFWMKELAKRTGIKEKTLEEEMEKAGGSAQPFMKAADDKDGADGVPKRQATRQELICEKLFSAALAKSDLAALDECVIFLNPTQKEIFRILKSGKTQSEDPSLDEAIGVIVLRAGDELTAEEIAALKAELAKVYYKERRRILAQAVKNAEANGNETELKAALEELRNLPGNSE